LKLVYSLARTVVASLFNGGWLAAFVVQDGAEQLAGFPRPVALGGYLRYR
jgi:hypothetical protein